MTNSYNKEELAQILGYDSEVEQNVEIVERGDPIDLPEPEEIEVEPESPAKNPWIQTGIVLAGSSLIVTFIVTLILGGFGGTKVAKDTQDKPKAVEEVEDKNEEEVGNWKTSAAISEQQQLLQQQNQSRQKTSPVIPTVKDETPPKPVEVKNIENRSLTPIDNTPSIEPTKVERVQTPPPLKVTRSTTPVSKVVQPPPVNNPPTNNVSRNKTPVVQTPPPKKVTWEEASNIGVFGGEDLASEEEAVETQQAEEPEEITEPVSLSDTIEYRSIDPPVEESPRDYREVVMEVEESTEPIEREEESVEVVNEKDKDKETVVIKKEKQPERNKQFSFTNRTKSTDKTTPLDSERYLLENKEMQVCELAIGTEVEGKIIQPLILNAGKGSKNILLVSLSEDLLDVNGKVALPKGTIVRAIAIIYDSGIVAATSAEVYLNNQTIEIPTAAFSLTGGGDEPLVAEEYKPDSDVLGSDLQAIFWGAAGNVGRVLSEPDVTTIANDSTIISTVENNRDVLGAVVDGAFTPYAESQRERSRQRLNELRSIDSSWFLPAGMEVKLVVTEPFRLRY